MAGTSILTVADDTLGVLYGHLACSLNEKHRTDSHGEKENDLDYEHNQTALTSGSTGKTACEFIEVQKMQSEGESGRQKLSQYTRYLTVLILCLQGPAYLVNLQVQVSAATGGAHMGAWTIAFLTVILAAGSMFIMWLGERITDRGIGNGISFIILVGIIARLPGALFYEFTSRLPGATGSQGGLIMFVVEIDSASRSSGEMPGSTT